LRAKQTLSKPAKPKRSRKPKQIAIAANLQQLEAGLREANAQLKEDGRRAAIAALEVVMEFLDSVPPLSDQNLATSIWALQAALKDLDHGRVVAMLAPSRKVRSRRPDPLIRKVAKAYAVFCVDILRREGSSTVEACRLVAKELKGAGFALGSRHSSPDWQTVKSWRDRVSKLPITDQTRQTLEGLRMALPRLKFHSLENAKKSVAGRLRSALQEEIGKPALE
jgi:hypothetical protein